MTAVGVAAKDGRVGDDVGQRLGARHRDRNQRGRVTHPVLQTFPVLGRSLEEP